jgi:signal peptidase I
VDETENIKVTDQSQDPWKGVFLSFVIPGMGQMYAGETRRGILFLLLLWGGTLAGMGYFGWVFFSRTRVIHLTDVAYLACMLLIWIVFELLMLIDAHRAINRSNLEKRLPPPPPQIKKPWLSTLLSYIFPGIGQFYNGQISKGLIFMGIEIFLLIANNIYSLTFIFCFIFEIYAMNDAFYVSSRTNDSPSSLFFQGTRRQIISLLGFLFILALIFSTYNEYLFKNKIVQAYHIPSASMSPTLRKGDHILAAKYNFSREKTRRGDVIVFKYPKDKKTDYVKRVIGLPGEKINILNNEVFINGRRLDEPYIVYHGSEKYGPYTIPERSYFVMGDNRDFSQDSRVWGPVPTDLIEGLVYKIYYPFSRSGPLQ